MPRLLDSNGFPFESHITVHTREGTSLENVQSWVPSNPLRVKGLLDKFRPPASTYLGSESPVYNCHGLTFASRRTAVGFKDQHLLTTLKDDGYTEVAEGKAQCGDVIFYLDGDGNIEHSGIVVQVLDFGDYRVWSKWGYGPEMDHRLAACPYEAQYRKFYRLTKWTPL